MERWDGGVPPFLQKVTIVPGTPFHAVPYNTGVSLASLSFGTYESCRISEQHRHAEDETRDPWAKSCARSAASGGALWILAGGIRAETVRYALPLSAAAGAATGLALVSAAAAADGAYPAAARRRRRHNSDRAARALRGDDPFGASLRAPPPPIKACTRRTAACEARHNETRRHSFVARVQANVRHTSVAVVTMKSPGSSV